MATASSEDDDRSMHGTRGKNLAARAGAWSARHKKKAIFGWLAFVAVALVLGSAFGTKQLSDDDYGTGESGRVDKLVDQAFTDSAEESILIQSADGDKVKLKAATDDVKKTVSRFETVELGDTQTSKDGRSVLVKFEMPGDDEEVHEENIGPIMAAVEKTADRHDDLFIGQFGDASAGKALSEVFEDDFRTAESLSIPITLGILIFAFGALVAAGLPVLLALSAVAAAIGLVALPSQFLPVDEAVSSVILLIGLAVGVDYSMFYLRREREERARGKEALAAIDAAAATSGRAVLVSGVTVMIAMAGMFLTGSETFISFAMGTIIVVAVAMIGSLTVLPALLALFGEKVDKGRIPLLHRLRRKDGESRVWNLVLDRVLKRPAIAAVLATGLLVALAIPAFGMHTANSGLSDISRDVPIMQTYDRMQAAFPGGQVPAVVVVKADDVTAPPVREALAELKEEALLTGKMNEPTTLTVSDDKTVATLQIPIQGEGTDEVSEAALADLRDIVPRTVGVAPGVHDAGVTGWTAGSKDFNDLMKSTAPLVFAFVLSLAFLLLLVTFRSVVIPLKAIVLNLLSVGAAYGVLVLVFQEGVGADLLGVDPATQGAITSWLPMFLFVILFGLSMDYHVFILSRIREAYDRGMETEQAVAHGIKTTASVVTAAAIVMVGVFSVFGTLSFIDMKQMGVGLAAAVLIDATIIRAVLLPAAMKLLGDWNWYLPAPLARRLPRRPALEHA
jgi:RND superfamily putative drug exporter